MHNKRTACHAQWDILRLWAAETTFRDLEFAMMHEANFAKITNIANRHPSGREGWKVGGLLDLWFDDEKAFAFIDSPGRRKNKIMQISYLSIPLIQKTEKAFCRNYFLEFSGSKSERVCMRWSTFYVSEISCIAI